MTRDIYRAIMIAAANGRGLHLTADECFDLSLDDAIHTRANNTISETDWSKFEPDGDRFWKSQRAYVQDEPANLAGFHRDDPDRKR